LGRIASIDAEVARHREQIEARLAPSVVKRDPMLGPTHFVALPG